MKNHRIVDSPMIGNTHPPRTPYHDYPVRGLMGSNNSHQHRRILIARHHDIGWDKNHDISDTYPFLATCVCYWNNDLSFMTGLCAFDDRKYDRHWYPLSSMRVRYGLRTCQRLVGDQKKHITCTASSIRYTTSAISSSHV